MLAALLLLPGSAIAGASGKTEISSRFLPSALPGGLNVIEQTRRCCGPGWRNAGGRRVSVVDGYRLILAYSDSPPFANVKVELSSPERFVSDSLAVHQSLSDLKDPAKDLVKRSHRGVPYTLLRDSDLECDCGVLAMGVMALPEHNLIVTAYFLNQTGEGKPFQRKAELRTAIEAFFPSYIDAVAHDSPLAPR